MIKGGMVAPANQFFSTEPYFLRFLTHLLGPDLITKITEERQKGEDNLAPKCVVGIKEERGVLGWLKSIKANVCWIFGCGGGGGDGGAGSPAAPSR